MVLFDNLVIHHYHHHDGETDEHYDSFLNVKVKMAAMTMTRPYVKVVIKLEHKIIMGKFTQDEAKTTQRLPTTVESMFRTMVGHENFPLRIINFSWVACDNSL